MFTCQGLERIARQRHLFVQHFNLQARTGQAAFALAQFQCGVEPGIDAVTHQLEGFLALGQGALCHGRLLAQADQLKVRPGHLAGQQYPRRLGVGLGGARVAQRSIKRRAVLAEKVQLPAGGKLGRSTRPYRAGQWWRHGAVGDVALARQVQLAVDLRQRGYRGHFAHGLRPCQTGFGQLQVRAGLQGLGHQAVERFIAKLAPPLDSHRSGRGRRIRTGQRSSAQAGLRRYTRHVGTAGDADGHQACRHHTGHANQQHAHRGAPHRQFGLCRYARSLRRRLRLAPKYRAVNVVCHFFLSVHAGSALCPACGANNF